MTRICRGCDTDISDRHPSAKTCSNTCRVRISSQRRNSEPGNSEPANTEGTLQLVEHTQATLVKTGLLLTPEGQLLMHLANKLAKSSTKETGSSMASLSKEYSRVLADIKSRDIAGADPIDILLERRRLRMVGEVNVS